MARTRHRSAGALAALVALGGVLAGIPGGFDSPAYAQEVPVAGNAVTGGAVTMGQVNPLDREAVKDGYKSLYRPALSVPSSSTHSAATCTPGAPSPEYSEATYQVLNYARRVAGVQVVGPHNSHQKYAQSAALAMEASGKIAHEPDSSWKCVTAEAREGLWNGALALVSTNGIVALLNDAGELNKAVGHRSRLLDYDSRSMGIGLAGAATVVYDTREGDGVPASSTMTPFRAWPSSGYFPDQLIPSSNRWSFKKSGYTTASKTSAARTPKK